MEGEERQARDPEAWTQFPALPGGPGDFGQDLFSLWVQSIMVSGWSSSTKGYLAGQGTERGRIQTFIGLEHVFLVVI